MAAVQTVRCPKCGHENRPQAKFCANCGNPLALLERAPKPPPSEAVPPASVVTEEAKEAAKKIWDMVKTVVTVGGRTAWLELTNPEPVLEGTVTEQLKVEAITPPSEPAFWGAVAIGFILLVFSLVGNWLFPLIATVTFLVLSWLKWRRPYFSILALTTLGGILRRQAPSLNLKVKTAQGEQQVIVYGDMTGDEPKVGDRIQVWGVFDDKAQTKARAWKLHVLDETRQPKGQPLVAPRLLPLVPVLFFVSLVMFVLALLVSAIR
ncbi:MAG: zinc ribbon domain-containing protein [Candidatus Fervidibacter sp.]|uniref:zinc ribbon domain-containing protein n=1 Tax=Candidatus Fervidibacter sp. TaxID=3100871 RepID=UPI00404B3DCC